GADGPFVEETGLAQHRKVLGNGRPRHPEPFRDGSGRHFPLANEFHDLEPGLVAQRLNLQKYGQLAANPLVLLYVRKNLRHYAAVRNTPCNLVRRGSRSEGRAMSSTVAASGEKSSTTRRMTFWSYAGCRAK